MESARAEIQRDTFFPLSKLEETTVDFLTCTDKQIKEQYTSHCVLAPLIISQCSLKRSRNVQHIMEILKANLSHFKTLYTNLK